MTYWLTAAGLIVILFGFVVAFGAPYVPTLKRQRQTALDMLDLRPGQTLFDLGCGDGCMLKAAAERGLKVVGFEINPILAAIAWLRTWRYRNRVRVVWGNFWKAQIKEADGVFVFLIDHYMSRLDNLLQDQFSTKPVKVASYAFPIPNRQPAAKQGAIFLYRYGRLARRR